MRKTGDKGVREILTGEKREEKRGGRRRMSWDGEERKVGGNKYLRLWE